jgi:hypothetical protein
MALYKVLYMPRLQSDRPRIKFEANIIVGDLKPECKCPKKSSARPLKRTRRIPSGFITILPSNVLFMPSSNV